MKEANDTPKVYVSYSRQVEEDEPLIFKMNELMFDVAFLIDTEGLQYRDNFDEFIQRIGEAKYVVVILSAAYCRSFYCMYELSRVMLYGGDLKARVFTIRINDYRLDSEVEKLALRDYWQQVLDDRKSGCVSEGCSSYGTAAEIQAINDQLDSVFDEFSRRNAPDVGELPAFDTLKQQAFQPIRDWLKDVIPSVLDGKSRNCDEQFCGGLRMRIADVFYVHDTLYEMLARRFGAKDEVDLADKLCGTNDFKKLLSTQLHMGLQTVVKKTRSQQVNEEQIDQLKSDIQQLVSCLGVHTISAKWAGDSMSKPGVWFDLPAATGLGQAFGAARLDQAIPMLGLAKDNIHDVFSTGELKPRKPVSWSNKSNQNINELLRQFYNLVFPLTGKKEERVGEGVALTSMQRTALNTEIMNRAEQGGEHHFLVIRSTDKKPDFLTDEGIVQGLRTLLPALDIFRLRDALGNTLFVGTDEHELSQTYRRFLEQLETW